MDASTPKNDLGYKSANRVFTPESAMFVSYLIRSTATGMITLDFLQCVFDLVRGLSEYIMQWYIPSDPVDMASQSRVIKHGLCSCMTGSQRVLTE